MESFIKQVLCSGRDNLDGHKYMYFPRKGIIRYAVLRNIIVIREAFRYCGPDLAFPYKEQGSGIGPEIDGLTCRVQSEPEIEELRWGFRVGGRRLGSEMAGLKWGT